MNLWHYMGIGLGIGLILCGLFWGAAGAHDATSGLWTYPRSCCRGTSVGGDCDAIPHTAVQPVDGGYQVTLNPGDHPLITETQTWFVPMQKVRWSKDNDFHVCLWPDETKLQCFFSPPMGS